MFCAVVRTLDDMGDAEFALEAGAGVEAVGAGLAEMGLLEEDEGLEGVRLNWVLGVDVRVPVLEGFEAAGFFE